MKLGGIRDIPRKEIVMRTARLTAALLLILATVPQAHAAVSCADPDHLCTGDPCTITNADVESPCVVNFGNRTLIIAGILRVPDDGILEFTAGTIRVQGPIDGRHVGNGEGKGASIKLVATIGDADLRGEIDVSGTVETGSIEVEAQGTVFVKDRLNAKPAGSHVTASGGTIHLTAGGTLATDQTAVIDVEGGGGDVAIHGGSNVTIKGRVRAVGNPSGTIQVMSDSGGVILDNDLHVEGVSGPGGTVTVSAQGDVKINGVIHATSENGDGGNVTIASTSGDVAIVEQHSVRGISGGSFSINAPLATIELPRLDANGTGGDGGSITVNAATITVPKNLEVRGSAFWNGNGGTIALTATTGIEMTGGDARADGYYGGTIKLHGDAASGDITVTKTSYLKANGRYLGGFLEISAPAGTVRVLTKVYLAGKTFGGDAHVDGMSLEIGPGVRFDAAGGTSGGQLRFDQSGTGVFNLKGIFGARRSGTIEATSAGTLVACGSFRVAPDGFVGLCGAMGTDLSCAISDVPISAICP
jgi:hypothetical protein